jgi:hypothetical protein
MPIVECPACRSRELYDIEQVRSAAGDSVNGVVDFQLFADYGLHGEMGWMGQKNKMISLAASARVCGACGHASLFVKDLAMLKELATKGLVRRYQDPS